MRTINNASSRLKPRRHHLLYGVCLLAILTLGAGVCSPGFTIVPSVGDSLVDSILIDLLPEWMEPKTYSLYSVVVTLLTHDEITLGLVILSFSIIFPILKLLLIYWLSMLAARLRLPHPPRIRTWREWTVKLLHALGKWSMLDVFVLAVIVAGFKEFPGGTRIYRRWGLLCFAVSVILSIVASMLVERMSKVHEKEPTHA